jgi:phage protein U
MSKNIFENAREHDGHETIGEQIQLLAEAFSHEGDIHGVYILEQAAEEAKALKSYDVRKAEFDVLMARCRDIIEEHKRN